MKKILAGIGACIIGAGLLTGCVPRELTEGLEAAAGAVKEAASQVEASQQAAEEAAQQEAASAEAAPALPSETFEATITLSDTEPPQIDGGGASVSANGVAIQAGGTYTIQGSSAAAVVEVYAPGADVQIVLNSLSLRSDTSPALYLSAANTVRLVINDGTENSIAGGSKEFSGAIYSNAPLIIAGGGHLDVNGLSQNAVMIRGDLRIESGHLTMQAYRGGITAATVQIGGGSVYVNAKLNGIEASRRLEISGGTVFAFGAEQNNSYGLRSAGGIAISGGEVLSAGAFNQSVAEGSQPCAAFTYTVQRSSTTFHILQGGEQQRVFEVPAGSKAMMYCAAGLTPGSACTLQVDGEEISACTVSE